MHYTLIACVIFLQITAIVIWYNESSNDSEMSKTMNSMDSLNRITHFTNNINNSFVDSQKSFNNYSIYKDKESLNAYTASLNDISRLIDSLSLITKDNKEFMKVLQEKNQSEHSVESLKSSIDSIIESQVNPDKNNLSRPFKLNKFEYKKILDSIKTDSYMTIDSVSKKGLFSRLGAALAGKVDIQKEQLKITVTMKYNNKIVTGSIEEQFANLFNTTNKYYENQFINLKKSFDNLKDQEAKLKRFNNELLNLEAEVMPHYNNSLKVLQDNTQKQLQKQYDSNKIVRNYTIAILILLMFIISLVLFGFTRLAFQYEKRLTMAQLKIHESLNFKNRIMGMVSHEIRSPLSIISIYSKMIGSSIKDPEIKDTFKSIQFTTNSLLLLANQILEYSKDENYAPKLNKKKFHLKEEIHQIVNSMTSLVESKGNKIEVNSNLILELDVDSDAAKIHQLFYNIIGNANKFTENGLIKVKIDLERTSDKKVNLKVEIEDSGIGIAKNDLKNIFELYYQGTVSDKVNNLGVGLGLNLCKEIVELFNGKIDVQSEEGKGTKIIFNLLISLV
ncbi:ATP-binding protein [Flavobacterium sp. FlaQc-50]|uniref:sensor histidine kinase n=1 Tax=unclassified Flavobacterium TaxID=196869 RepID=UPI003756B7AC